MSFINYVRGQNFRGQNFERKLGAMTLITGDNFRGKTTILDAIRLALSGYLPSVGKATPVLWNALAGDPEREGTMAVEIGFDNGRTSKLEFARSKKGAVSLTGAVPADLLLDPMLLDVRQFFALTEAQRTGVIYRASGETALDKDVLKERLGGIEASPAKVRDELLRTLCAEIDSDGFDIERTVAGWKDELKTTKAAHKVEAGAFAGMTLPLHMPKDPGDLKPLEARRDALHAKRGELAALLRADMTAASSETTIQAAREGLDAARKAQAELEELDEEPPERPALLDEYEMIKPEVEGLKERLATLAEETERLQAELAGLQGVTICPHCGERGGMDRARAHLGERIRELETSAAAAKAKLDETLSPFVELRIVAAVWQEAMNEYRGAKKQHDDAAAAVAKAEAALKAQEEKAAAAKGDRSALIEQLKAETAELPEVEKALAEGAAAKAEFDRYQLLLDARTKKEAQTLRLACAIDVYDGAIRKVNDYMIEKSEAAFGKVLKLSAPFTTGLLHSPLEFRDGELGRRVSKEDREAGLTAPVGAWIPRQSFSGTEELLAMCGFSVALAQMSGFILVVLDELGRLTSDRRKAVAKRMSELLRTKAVHQVIMIDPEPPEGAYRSNVVRIEV